MEYILSEILKLSKKKMREQGAYTRDAFSDIVDETIQYFIEKGKLSDQENLEFIKDRAMEVWTDIERELSE